MVSGIVITGKGTVRSARVRRAKAWEYQGHFVAFGGGSKGSLAFHNNRHSDSPVAARHRIERGFTIEFLSNSEKKAF